MNTPAPPWIVFERVSQRFGHGDAVLRDFNLHVPEGRFVALVGPSGCGKTTLLRMLAGLLTPSEGTLTLGGRPPGSLRAQMAYIFQEATLLPWRRVGENLALPLELRGTPPSQRETRVQELATLVGLEGVLGHYPRELSGGMAMRASVARALTLQPRLLLLDEPFASVDALTREHLQEELLRLRAQAPWTGILVTHDVEEAVFLADTIVVLASGPGRLAAEVDNDLPAPRTGELRESELFGRRVAEVHRLLRENASGGRPA